jgi:hypothetical protein
MKRISHRTIAYAEKVEFVCANPECNSGLNPEVHHIIPLAKGGEDTEENMICLCLECHRNNELHSDFEHKQTTLYVWKLYAEERTTEELPEVKPIVKEEDDNDWEEIPLTKLGKKKHQRGASKALTRIRAYKKIPRTGRKAELKEEDVNKVKDIIYRYPGILAYKIKEILPLKTSYVLRIIDYLNEQNKIYVTYKYKNRGKRAFPIIASNLTIETRSPQVG